MALKATRHIQLTERDALCNFDNLVFSIRKNNKFRYISYWRNST